MRPVAQHHHVDLRAAVLVLAACCSLALCAAGPAGANMLGKPEVQLSRGAQPFTLYGHDAQVHLTTSLSPTELDKGYNVAYYVLLPPGAHYEPGSAGSLAGEPDDELLDPVTGETTLHWNNLTDLVKNSNYTLSFAISYRDTSYTGTEHVYDVPDVLPITWGAFITTKPFDEVDWDPITGEPVVGTLSSTENDWEKLHTSTTLSGIEVLKSGLSPENELPRGVHDKQTVYTLTVQNNKINPTRMARLEDYLPAGLEYLDCAGTADHTTDAPTNPTPGDPDEYKDSGPIIVSAPAATDDCVPPDVVETVDLDPDGPGPLPPGVYTHVKWDSIGDFEPNDSMTFRYGAAIPIRENTMTWVGGTAPDETTGEQAANLDNNSGPETYDEQPLLNGAIVHGTYEPPAPSPSKPVSFEGTLLVTAEDIAIQKSNNNHGLEAGDSTLWTLDVQTSEYRSLDNVVIEDTVPDGLCPVDGTTNWEHAPEVTTECAGDSGQSPPSVDGAPTAYSSVAEQPGGTYVVVFDQSTVGSLAHIEPGDERQIKFETKTREYYQNDPLNPYENGTPILSRDSVTNAVHITGDDWVRCWPAPYDCSGDGTPIDHDETPDGAPDTDVSLSGKAAGGVTIDKQVGLPPIGGNCATATYTDTVPEYGPSDPVCWKIRIDFLTNVHTNSLHIQDFLPTGVSFVAQGPMPGTNNIAPVTFTSGSPLEWTLGIGGPANDFVELGPGVFEYWIETTAGSPLGHHSGDVEGNLMKFAYKNTQGNAFTLRDHADFKFKIPELSLLKGVAQITSPDGTSPHFGPNEDGKQVTGRDSVQYRLDVTNSGTADASSSRIIDELPPGLTCADIVAGSISDGGMCIGSHIEWPSVPVAAKATVTLTYTLKVPVDASPCTPYDNVAGVVEWTYTTSDHRTYKLVPDNPTVKDPDLGAPNMPAAEDASRILVRCATVTKERRTSADEAGNNRATEATIGETLDYKITTTIPEGTTMYGIPKLVDDLGPRQALASAVGATLNGIALPPTSVTVVGSVITVTLPSPYANPVGDDLLVLTFAVKVLDVDDNVRGSDLPNTATLSYLDDMDVPKTASGTVSTRIVEPDLALAKSHAPSGPVHVGDVVHFTIAASNQTGSDVSMAHDVVVIDKLPVGTDPVFTDPTDVGPQHGVWDPILRTITWTIPALAPGATEHLTYDVTIQPTPVAGQTYTNTAVATATSLEAVNGGVRTHTSTASTAPDYEAHAEDVLRVGLPSVKKEVSPDKVTIGGEVTWTVTLTFPKDVQYFDATGLDFVPAGIDFDGPGPIGPANCSGCPATDPSPVGLDMGAASAPLRVAWFLGDLPSAPTDRVYTFELHGHVRDSYPSGAKVREDDWLTNSAEVRTNRTNIVVGTPPTTPATFDDHSGSATATNQVVEPKLKITKSADKGPFVGGGAHVTYTIAITNTGTSPAYDIVVQDRPDGELTNIQTVPFPDPSLVDDWMLFDPDMRWEIPGPIAPGATMTLTYTADVQPAGVVHADDQITNTADIIEYWGVGETTRNAHPWVFRQYEGPQSTVTLTVAVPRLTIEKTPDDCMVIAGSDATFTIKVTNQDTHATANGVAVTDTLAPGLTYTPGDATANPNGGPTNGGFSETSASGQSIAWLIASLAPGASVTITVPVHVGAGVPEGTVLVNSASTHSDEVPDEQTDTGSLIVEAKTDLKVTKASQPGPVVPGTNVDYTMVMTNEGPADALSSKLKDTLPSYLSFVSIDDTTHCVVTGQTIECDFGTLAAGDTRTIHVTARLDASRTTPIKNVVDVTTTTPEQHDANNRAKAINDVAPRADVSIEKFADGALFDGGETVTYTLVAHNAGPSVAQAVKVDDDIPAGVTFASVTPGPPICTYAAGHVHCDLGALAPGADSTVTIVTTANNVPAGAIGATSTHTITMSKVEETILVSPGETKTTDVACAADASATDGSVRIPGSAVAQVRVGQARSVARGTYRFTVTNDGTSPALPIRLVVTCLPRATDPATHSHELDVGALQTLATGPLPPGRHVRTIAGPAGQLAVAPGIEVGSGVVRLVGSEPAGSGRTFTIDVLATAEVTLSTRTLDHYTAPGDVPAHAHALSFAHVAETVTLAPGLSEHSAQCAQGYAGVVASYVLRAGSLVGGIAPLDPARVFTLLNTTSQASDAAIDVACVAVRAGDPVGVVPAANDATVDTTSLDPVDANDHGRVTIGLRVPPVTPPGTGGTTVPPPPGTTTPVVVAGPGPTTTAPVTTTKPAVSSSVSLGTVIFESNAAHLAISVTCKKAKTCNGRVTVTAPSPNRPRSTAAALKTITLGRKGYSIKPHKTARIRVTIARRYRSLLRSGRVKTVTITSGNRSVKRKVVLPPAPKAKRPAT